MIIGVSEAPVYPSLIVNTVLRVGRHHAPNTIGFQIAAGGVGGTAITSLVGVLATSKNLELIALGILVLFVLTFVTFEVMPLMQRSVNTNPLVSPLN